MIFEARSNLKGLDLSRPTWVIHNRLQIDSDNFRLSMYKLELASREVCASSTKEPTVDHIALQNLKYGASNGINDLVVLNKTLVPVLAQQ